MTGQVHVTRTRPGANKQSLATGKRAGQAISSLASSFAEGVAQASSDSIAESLLELLDVFLVGSRDFVDLVWRRLAGLM
jgi:hypothetical protein